MKAPLHEATARAKQSAKENAEKLHKATQKNQSKIRRLAQQVQDALNQTLLWRFIIHFISRFMASRLTLLAAGLTYYAAFSLGPLILLCAGILVFFLSQNPEVAHNYREAIVQLVSQLMPLSSDATAITEQAFDALLTLLQEGALFRSSISLLVLLWSSSNFFNILLNALEVIFDEQMQPRTFWQKRLTAFTLVGLVGLVVGFEVIGQLFASLTTQALLLVGNAWNDLLVTFSIMPVDVLTPITFSVHFMIEIYRLVIMVIIFTYCFQVLPRRATDWSGALIGALFSTGAIWLTRQLLPYFLNVERFNLMYGFITGPLLLLLWLFITLQLVLLGALISSEMTYFKHELKRSREQPRLL